MISIDQDTILALLPPAGLALLGLLVIVVDIIWQNRDRLVTMNASRSRAPKTAIARATGSV